jgi:hypothetical protein
MVKKKRQDSKDAIHDTLKIIIPEICSTEAGKQLFNIFSRFVGYHSPVVVRDGNGRVDTDATLHDEGMRNSYRYFRSYMPLEKMAEIEHGTYPYDIGETEETK